MSNEIQEQQNSSLQLTEDELKTVLKSSVYPDAKDSSIKMVIDYCKGAKLDPLKKPVELVPMNYKDYKGEWINKDVIIHGINFYRIQAERSGRFMGISEPEFGEDITQTFSDNSTVTYPKYCRITAYKLMNGVTIPYTVKELWVENYAEKKDGSPNKMWRKRPYAQLAKNAESQALRRAFPELCATPSQEEMEGKIVGNAEPEQVNQISSIQDSIEQAKRNQQSMHQHVNHQTGEILGENNANARYGVVSITDEKVNQLKALWETANLSDEDKATALSQAGITSFDELSHEDLDKWISAAKKRQPESSEN